MRSIFFLLLAGLALIALKACSPKMGDEALVKETCSSCHRFVAPALLPRSIWEKRVLPEMGARLGMLTFGYDPARQLPPGEYELALAHGFYPQAPTLDPEAWERVRQYILTRAPDTLPLPRPLHLDSLSGFVARPLTLDDQDGSLITYIGQDASGLIVGDGYGQLTRVSPAGAVDTLVNLQLPLVHFTSTGEDSLLLEIGNIYPTEASNGKLYRLTSAGPAVLYDSLHRPVYHMAADLDGDGAREIVICEYGNFSGALSLLDPDGSGGFTYRRLLGAAGCTRVVAADLNRDGLADLVVLHAQGDEGIDALYQQPDGSFLREPLLQFPAVWGTSWFELVDFDGDGDQDLITVHGDNADYSNVIKPYHGLRIYTNDGNDDFSETYFQPLPGATRVVARDFDRDGDFDLAVASNFADFDRQPQAAFVYLEQLTPGPGLSFHASTVPQALDGRWLILEAADYDQDGDDDIALGSFTLNPAPVPNTLARRWRESRTDVLLLENLLPEAR
ncbi:VCBS repeat protein [Neolewinella xylanilytica]|uniref:VCBS repeat protein n=1 Tax=Neolewinella xylanilytica TaxID=1514080 RepID=A0A2S6I3N9_9BACT|nr:VCBS repeat-containing protein [Neolewinella xylanilytica]PPK85796.1 VCBS repeat protein [Neolewinella xylanilytica]